MDKKRLERIPDSYGVYIFKDKTGAILYIGKARSLKKRVKYYFSRPLPVKIQIMASKIASVDYVVTKSESQARIYEDKLIKEHQPHYNTVSRDDKSFPLICISKDDFAIVWVARGRSRRFKDSVGYYSGPYPNAGLLREALKSIRRIFGFRTCKKMPKKACLYYRLKLCPAPCIGQISKRKYKENIKNIIMFLEGKYQDLIDSLAAKMYKLSMQKKFEEAAVLRNQIQALSSISEGKFKGLDNKSNQYALSLSNSAQEAEDLKQALGLKISPKRIEAFDVSNISGCNASASMVSFYNGQPDKNNYRRFRIKTVVGIDDCKMLEEAVGRRYRRLSNEGLPLPDLVIVDGGKGQLNIAKRQLDELGLKIPVISIAKPPREQYALGKRKKEKIFIPGQKMPIELKPGSSAFLFIQRIRDEAHRFALSYHHILRRKKTLGE